MNECYKPLAAVLRTRARKIIDDDKSDPQRRDDAELFNVLARMLEGKTVHDAFGAPGDWGYETEIGRQLQTCYAARARAEVPS